MKYQNAKDYLSEELFDALQQQAGGQLLYVPTAGEKKSWGEVSGERVKLRKRNAIICREHAEGMTASQLADKWFLSVASIRKILAAGRQLPPDHYLGIDIGDSNIKYAITHADATIIESHQTPTPHEEHEFLQTLQQIITDACRQDPYIRGVGVGVPGFLANNNTVNATNLPLKNTALGHYLRRCTSLPVLLENDANCAALGEYTAANDTEDLLYLVLGAGIGGGLVIGGQLYRGHHGFAGEIGHMTIEAGGLPCPCGQKGCFEQYASTSALIRQTKQAIADNPTSILTKLSRSNPINGHLPFTAKAQGCPVAANVIDRFCQFLAIGIDSLVRILDPKHIVLAGAITAHGEDLLSPLRPYLTTDTPVTLAHHYEYSGVIGAARLFKGKDR